MQPLEDPHQKRSPDRGRHRAAHRDRSSAVEQIQAAISYFQVAAGKRVAELMFGVVQAVNQRKLGLAALAIRSLLEVTAMVSFTETRLERRLQAGLASREDVKEVSDLLDKPIRKGRFDWETLLGGTEGLPHLLERYASDPRSAQRRDQVSVITRIEQLDKRAEELNPGTKGQVLFAYDLLSDICHPSAGSYLVYIAPERRPGWYGFDPLPSDDLLRQFCLWTTTPLVETLGRVDGMAMKALRSLAEGLREADVL